MTELCNFHQIHWIFEQLLKKSSWKHLPIQWFWIVVTTTLFGRITNINWLLAYLLFDCSNKGYLDSCWLFFFFQPFLVCSASFRMSSLCVAWTRLILEKIWKRSAKWLYLCFFDYCSTIRYLRYMNSSSLSFWYHNTLQDKVTILSSLWKGIT